MTNTQILPDWDSWFDSMNGSRARKSCEWLSASQVGKELGLHINTVYKILQSGELRSFNCSVAGKKNYYRIRRDDLENYLEQRYCHC